MAAAGRSRPSGVTGPARAGTPRGSSIPAPRSSRRAGSCGCACRDDADRTRRRHPLQAEQAVRRGQHPGRRHQGTAAPGTHAVAEVAAEIDDALHGSRASRSPAPACRVARSPPRRCPRRGPRRAAQASSGGASIRRRPTVARGRVRGRAARAARVRRRASGQGEPRGRRAAAIARRLDRARRPARAWGDAARASSSSPISCSSSSSSSRSARPLSLR